jgi:hypothetical protein
MTEDVSTIKPGIYLQGDGGVSTGALILANKQADNYTDIVLCYSERSTHHPFVVWSYEHSSGICRRGDYFKTLEEAMNIYKERKW